jgi:phosphopantothenoylcysteine synthetase/decarboxylase
MRLMTLPWRRDAPEADDMTGKRVLLIVGGGVAAYKALELTRLLRKAGVGVRPILTKAGAEFVTPCPFRPWPRTRSIPSSSR